MMDILLIQPPIRDFYLTAKRTVPYGLACIASALRNEGFSVRIVDALATRKSHALELPGGMSHLRDFYPCPDISPFALFHEFRHFGKKFEKIGGIAAESGARIIGISSLFTAYSDEAIETAKAVRRACPGAVIVVGGHHPTEMPLEVLKNDCVDYVLRGEGEACMPRLAAAIRDGTALEEVPGIGFRTARGGVFLNPPAAMDNLDGAPLPAIDLIDDRFYRRRKKPCAVVIASRGCPLKCSYCSIGGASWSRFRLKSTERVLEELDQAVSGGARFIDFEDENISFDKKWFLSLLDGIQKRFAGLGIEFRAMNGLFPPTLDREVIGAMKDVGFTALNLSLCTTCPEQLKKFGRPDVRNAFERALKAARECGLETVGYIIAGAPGQRAEDSIADLLYLASQRVLAGVSVFYPVPGSADFEKCRSEKLLPPEFSLMRATALPISDTTSRKDCATLLRLGRVLNFMKSLTPEEIQIARNLSAAPSLTNPPVMDIDVLITKSFAKDTTVRDGRQRREIGKLLLAKFLRDGIVAGLTPEGGIIRHKTSFDLCLKFREGILRRINEESLRLFTLSRSSMM